MTTLAQDARNRAWRTLLQGLGVDILVAVGFVLYDALQSATPDYRLLLLSLVKTALVTVASFLMRLKTSIAAPPAPVPPPVDDDPETRARHAKIADALLADPPHVPARKRKR